MTRLLLPLAAIVVFFLLSLITVRVARPRDPKRFFLAYALLLLAGTAVAYLTIWPLETIDDALGLVSALLVQLLACLTMWNAFYSLLWGFSGGDYRTWSAEAGYRLTVRPCGCDRKARSWQSARSRPSSCFHWGWAEA